jgi:hypothetical protein
MHLPIPAVMERPLVALSGRSLVQCSITRHRRMSAVGGYIVEEVGGRGAADHRKGYARPGLAGVRNRPRDQVGELSEVPGFGGK